MTTQILDFNNIERKLFWVFSGALFIVVSLYLYSAFSLMGSVVAHERISSSSHKVLMASGNIEQEYIILKNSITLTRAKELGFKEIPVKFTTISASSDGDKLSGKLLSTR